LSSDVVQYWVALTRVEGLGTRGAHKLVEQLGSASSVFRASATQLERCGLSPRVAQSLCRGEGLQQAEAQIADPPLILYGRGDLTTLTGYSIAVVGTRRPTAYGGAVATRLARDLAERGLVIVSGLARGIDSAAHRGALEAHGKTVAVLGSGLDVIYPRENKRLAEEVQAAGAVTTEFPLGTSPAPENFPIRNRIISGLSLGTVIVEASEHSGSLITARLALEQNREIFAVPGNITSAQSFGPHHLIKQGAKLVEQWTDVLEELPLDIRRRLLPQADGVQAAAAPPESPSLFEASLTPEQKLVFDVLHPDQPMFIDAISGSIEVPSSQVLTTLLELEMSGLVRQLPGKNFIRKL
jgi:DNA processing protein